ncbi:MAG TPA: hypothetical protein VFA24_05730 [Gaiellaceae bacterium]|nr:hypothetical protein [Gaiellaceae bacterium]
MIVCFALAACLHAPAFAGAWAGFGRPLSRPPVSLVASPAHVALTGAAREAVTVTSSGRQPVVVEVARAGYALDLRGRPRVARLRSSWISVWPRRARIVPGGRATFVVASTPPRRAEPGDHSELVLLVTRPLRTAALSVRLRLGVVVVVRVPGRIVRRLDPLRVRVRARRLELLVANRGNVTETIGGRCVAVAVRRAGRLVARLHPRPRTLLPHTTGLLELPFRGLSPRRGRLRIGVAISPGPPCAQPRRRAFAIRLSAAAPRASVRRT